MRISKKDWMQYNIDLHIMLDGLGIKRMDVRTQDVRVVHYKGDGSGPTFISPVLRTRQELDTFIAGLRKGSELREKEVRTAIGKLFHDRYEHDDGWLIAMLTTWLP
jgi:hypothetical protein